MRRLPLRRLSGAYFGCKGLSHITSVNFYWVEQIHSQRIKRVTMLLKRDCVNNSTPYIFFKLTQTFLQPYYSMKQNHCIGKQRSARHHYSATLQLGPCSAHDYSCHLKHKLQYPFSIKTALSNKRMDIAEPRLFCSTDFLIPFPQWGFCRSLTRQWHFKSCSAQTQPKEPTWKLSSIIVLSSQGTRQPMRPQISLINSCVFVTFLFLSMQYGLVS